MYTQTGVLHWANVALWALDALSWIAYLTSLCVLWKHDKDSVELGIVWFAVYLHYFVLMLYIPIIFRGVRFFAHSAHTLLLVSFILSVIVANAARALTKSGLSKTPQRAAEALLGSVICVAVFAGIKLVTTTGEIDAVVGRSPRGPTPSVGERIDSEAAV